VWAILDKVVDDYAPVAAGIEDDIEEVEVEIFQEHRDATERIYFLKREVIEFHRAVSPSLVPLESLEHGACTTVDEQLRRYFRDIADHARRVDDQVIGQRELLTSILEANLAPPGRQPERGHPQHLRVRGDHRRPDLPRQHLGHELRAHAGAAPALGIPGGAGGDGVDDLRPLPLLRADRVAVAPALRSLRSP
jgi:CorA-like Mg2+ transporter protein